MEHLTWYCRWCWHELAEDAQRCSSCGHAIGEHLSYRQELELALACPVVQTARHAASLLGKLREPESVPALIHAVQVGDPYVAAEAVEALRAIDTPSARHAVAAADSHRYVTVRAAARHHGHR